MRYYRFMLLWLGIVGLGLLLQGCTSMGGGSGAAADGVRGQVVMAALSQLGTAYKYGAQAPGAALDCSALIQHAYGVAGVSIPRMSTDQRRSATPVRFANVRPGDLVFFRIRPGLSHVGLMVDDKRFVHASASKKQVRLSSIDSDYWRRRLIGAGTYVY
jgi:cell wall-associated NlpC family hydrolase